MPKKIARISDFLTKDQIKEAAKLSGAKEICEKIIRPNIQEINRKLEQENDPMYLAYGVLFALEMSRERSTG